MSRIPVFTRTVLPDRAVGGAAVEAARAPYDKKAAEFGALQQGIDRTSNTLTDFAIRDAAADNTTAVNQAAIDFKMKSSDLKQTQRDARQGDPENFHKDFDVELTKLQDDYLKAAPSETARVAMKSTLDAQRASLYEENQVWERTRKIESYGARVEKSADDMGRMAYERGLKNQPVDDLYNDADATTVAGSTFVAPEKVDSLNRKLRETVAEARLKGMAVNHPELAKKELTEMSRGHSSFDQAVSFTLNKEGGYADNDGGSGAPVNFGINQKANPDIDVKLLTRDKAQEIYKERYWNTIGADKMSPAFASVAFDGAVNQGVGWMNSVKEQAGGDPMKLIELREARYREIAKNPEKTKYLQGWLDRLSDLKKQVTSQTQFMPIAATPENTNGMISAGTIDLLTKPSSASVHTTTINQDGHEYLVPMVSDDGKVLTNDEAIATFRQTGKHLGVFNSPEAANSYASVLQKQQADARSNRTVDNLPFEKISSLMGTIQTEQDKQIKLRNEDPISYMQSRGDVPNQPLDMKSPDFQTQMQQRESAARTNALNYGTPLNVFNKAEADYYSRQLSTQTSQQRLQTLDTLRQSISSPRVYQAALQQIRPDSPAQAIAGMFLGLPATAKVGETNITPHQVAQNIVEGEDLLNPAKAAKGENGTGKVFPMPKDEGNDGLRVSFNDFVGDSFAGRPAEQAQVYQAFRAYYAAEAARSGDYSGVPDTEIAKRAALAVTGGVADKNGRDFLLPWGMEEDVFMDAAESNFQAIKKQFPQFTGAVEWGDVRLENTGEPGRYRMQVGAGYLHDAGGIPITLKMGS